MSGGSYDYLYEKVESMAGQLEGHKPLRRAFAAHLRMVARAMQDIEWVDSCDSSQGDEDESIRACLAPGAELEAVRLSLVDAMAEARSVLGRMDADDDGIHCGPGPVNLGDGTEYDLPGGVRLSFPVGRRDR